MGHLSGKETKKVYVWKILRAIFGRFSIKKKPKIVMMHIYTYTNQIIVAAKR